MELRPLLLSAQGRIRRKTYWLTLLGLMVVSSVLQGLGWAVAHPTVDDSGAMSFSVNGFPALILFVLFIAFVFLTIVSLFLAVKRCHDRDRSGGFILVGFIPLIGGIWLLVELGFLRGTIGPNRFGPDPISGLTLNYPTSSTPPAPPFIR